MEEVALLARAAGWSILGREWLRAPPPQGSQLHPHSQHLPHIHPRGRHYRGSQFIEEETGEVREESVDAQNRGAKWSAGLGRGPPRGLEHTVGGRV